MKRGKITTFNGGIPTFEQAKELFILSRRAKNLSMLTVDWYGNILSLYERELNGYPWHTGEAVAEYLRRCLESDKKDATVAGRVRALGVFFNWLEKKGYLKDNPIKKIEKVKVKRTIIKTFSAEQIEALLKEPDRKTFAGYRDYIAMCALLDTGVRLAELLSLKVGDLNLRDRTMLVLGKGNKERIVPFGKRLGRELAEYLSILKPSDDDHFLFCSVYDQKLSSRTFQDRITEYGRRANIRGVRVSPHTFRHTFAKMYYLRTKDLVGLQKILGHHSLEMTQRYVNLLDADVQIQYQQASPLDNLNLTFGRKKRH